MNTENNIAAQLHQQTVDLQAKIIANQQRDIDRLNSLAIDSAAEIARLNKVIEWLQGQTGKMLGAAAKAEIASAAPAEQAEPQNRNATLEEVALWYGDKGWLLDEDDVPTAIRALATAAPAAPLPAQPEQSATDWRIYHSALSRCAELLDNMADNDALIDTPIYLAEKLAALAAAGAAPLPELTGPSVGDDPEFIGRVIAAASAVMDGDTSGEWQRFAAYIDSRLAASPSPAPAQPTIPYGCAIDGNGATYHNIAEIYHQMEEGAALHMWLDDKGVPRVDSDSGDCVYSLVGRVGVLAGATPAQQPDPKGGLDIDDVIAELGIADEVAAIRSKVAPARRQEPSPSFVAVDAYDAKDGVDGQHPSYGRGVFFTLNCMKTLYESVEPAAPGASTEDAELDSALYDAMAEQLSDLYSCGRVWSAWSVGTMSEDDFSIASEDEDIIANFVSAVRSVLDKRAGASTEAKQ